MNRNQQLAEAVVAHLKATLDPSVEVRTMPTDPTPTPPPPSQAEREAATQHIRDHLKFPTLTVEQAQRRAFLAGVAWERGQQERCEKAVAAWLAGEPWEQT